MSEAFSLRAAAKRDLAHLFGWLERDAGTDVAERMLLSAYASFRTLANQPGLGPDIQSSNLRLHGLRKWRVERFPKLLIFYTVKSQRVSIIRVLHTAQDWWGLLDIG